MLILIQMNIIFLLPILSVATELKITNLNSVVIIRNDTTEYSRELRLLESESIHKFPNRSGNIFDIQLKKVDKNKDISICRVQQKYLTFDDYQRHTQVLEKSEMQQAPSIHQNDPSYFLSSPILANLAHITQGFAAVTTDHQLVLFSIKESDSITGFQVQKETSYNFSHLRTNITETEIPQIVYDPYHKWIFIIYFKQVIAGKVDRNSNQEVQLQTLKLTIGDHNLKSGLHNSNKFIGQVKIALSKLFVPVGQTLNIQINYQGSDGLDIFGIEPNGELTVLYSLHSEELHKNSNSKINIVDVAIGGNQSQYLYILDENFGIISMIMDSSEDKFSLRKNDLLGDIPYHGCKMIKEFNEKTLLLLCEKGQNSILIEYGLHLPLNQWFKVKTHYLNGRYFDIDITNEFALLRGVDAHRVIFHGILEGFQPTFDTSEEDDYSKEYFNQQDLSYLYVPHLQAIEFYSANFGLGNSKGWNYNHTHSFILGMTTHSIAEIPWLKQEPGIQCGFASKESIGKIITYEIALNQTNCLNNLTTEKKEKQMFADLPDQLVECQELLQMSFTLTESDQYKFNTEEMFSIAIGLTVLLFLTAMLLAYLYKKFKNDERILSDDISGFESKGYNMDSNKVIDEAIP